MSEEQLLIEQKDHIGTLTLNRPEKRNALSVDMLLGIRRTLNEWAESGDIRVVVITGAGDKAFSAGYDVAAIPTNVSAEDREAMKGANPFELALEAVRNFPYPVIAMMNGFTFGGALNLAICCDIRLAVEHVKVGMPPAKLGMVYFPEGMKQFVGVVGMARAREIFFTGKPYVGQDAADMGLVDHLFPEAELAEKTYAMAAEIAQNAPLSLRGSKRILNMIGDSLAFSPEALAEAEGLIQQAFQSKDLQEGQMAFLQKRTPVFTGE